MKIYDWRELNLQSLDLILCAGESKLSRRIRQLQRLTGGGVRSSKITHTAGMFNFTPLKITDYAQESTTFNKWAKKRGVQVNVFEDWLLNYNGRVYIRKLDFERKGCFFEKDLDFWTFHQYDDYESGIPGGVELLLCVLRLHRFIPWYSPIRTKEIHCTELVAKRIKAHRLWKLTSEITINRMPPWLWYKEIDQWLKVPIGPMLRIK